MDAASARTAPAPRTGAPTLALAAMVLASALASLFWAAVSLALPSIHGDLGTSIGELRWTVTGAGLAFSATLILAGRLGDVHGRRRLLTTGFALLALSSAGAALARSGPELIVAVSLMGAAAAILTPISLAVVTETFGPDRRAQAIAIWGGAGALAYGLGPAVGGMLAHAAGWRWIFWMYVPLTLAGLVLTRLSVPKWRPDRSAPVDLRGAALLGGGLMGASLILAEGQSWGWTAPASIASVVAAVGLLAAFVVHVRRAASPLVDLGLFRNHAYTVTNLVLFCVNFVLGALLFFVPLYLQEVRGESPLDAGLMLLPLSAAMLAAMPLGGRLAARGHARTAIGTGVAIATVAAWLLSDVSTATGYDYLLPVLTLIGLGIGLAVTPINVAAMSSVPAGAAGTASGVLGTSRGLGTALGVAASGALFQYLNVEGTIAAAARRGVRLTEEAARSLDGLLAGSDPAQRAHARLGADADAVLVAVRDGFVSALSGTLRLSALVGLVAIGLTFALLRRDGQATARPTTDTTTAPMNTASSTATTALITRSPGDA